MRLGGTGRNCPLEATGEEGKEEVAGLRGILGCWVIKVWRYMLILNMRFPLRAHQLAQLYLQGRHWTDCCGGGRGGRESMRVRVCGLVEMMREMVGSLGAWVVCHGGNHILEGC